MSRTLEEPALGIAVAQDAATDDRPRSATGVIRAGERGGAGVGESSLLADRGLIEREAELARLRRVFDRVGAGSGTVMVVEGPAGIGKSELLAAARAGAQARGLGVLMARGSEFEAEIAFGVARQLFEPMLHAASPVERRRLLDGVARIGARALGLEEGTPPADPFAAIHGLFWLCANHAARQPLVVAVDDVQWADDPSLGWLGYLARRVGDLRVALIVTLRSRAGDEPAELAQFVGDADVERVSLEPLSAAAVRAMVRTQLDEEADEPFTAACSELTGGNPLFLRELLTAARDEGLPDCDVSVAALHRIAPAAVGTSVLGRLGRLGANAIALARAVAVVGAGAEVALAARLAGMDPAVAELTADRLAAAHVLAATRPLEFFHPLIGAAIREDMAPGARRVAHRRAAELLDRDGQGEPAHVAAHLLACGPAGDAWVVRQLREAAREALDRGGPEIAATYVRRALVEPPMAGERAALLLLLGTAEWRAGQPDAVAHLEQALAGADDDHRTLIAASGLLSFAYAVSDQAERAVEALERTLAAMGDTETTLALTEPLSTIEPALTDAPLTLITEAAIVAAGMMNERTAPAALRRAEGLCRRLSSLEDPPVHLLVMLARHSAGTNRAAEAWELAQRALACEPYPPPLDICVPLIVTLTMIEHYDAVARLCEDLLAEARGRGAMHETIGVLVCRASASCDRGALADAQADAGWALERAVGVRRIHAASELIRVLVERDELQQAEDLLERCPDPKCSGSVEVIRFLIARGQLRSAQGRPQMALGDFLDGGRRCERFGLSTLIAAAWRAEAALGFAAVGDPQQARRLASEQLELARAFGTPRTLGISLRALGLVEPGEAGLDLLREAVRTLERSESSLELARALSDYGAALRRAGRRVEARAQLERALDLAHHWGARRIANQARSELIAAGAKPRRDAITGRDALTVSELRVARLAAEGLSNREIAQALFITTATTKAHLNHIYRKLKITRREQLSRALSGAPNASHEQPIASVMPIP
jgi:DNA-binding CsgD family transcriptional regulator